MDEIMAKAENQNKPAKPKPQNLSVSPELRELMHMLASLEKQPATAKG
jgi:hypothetical protein